MESIRLIYNLNELRGSCYFELLPGEYQGRCWNETSVFFTEEVFSYVEPIIEFHEPNFDHHSFVVIGKDIWKLIIQDFEKLAQELKRANNVKEIEGRLGFTFSDSAALFSNNFRSNANVLADMLRDLSEWLWENLKRYEVISVLGI